MTQLSEREAADLARTRDASATPYATHHTDPASYIADLRADHELGAVDDGYVRLAIVARQASLQELYGTQWVPGGDRPSFGFSSKRVTSSYFSRGRLVTLVVYCGVSWTLKAEPRGTNAATLTQETALKLTATQARIKAAIKELGLQQRGGDVVIDEGVAFIPDEYETVEDGDTFGERCASCDKLIYYANNEWRHEDTKRAETTIAAVRNGRAIRQLDHVADPTEVGRKS